MPHDRPLRHVVAFIQPFQLESVVDSLRGLPDFPGMSVSEVRGFGARSDGRRALVPGAGFEPASPSRDGRF
jgi:nitrogen regulatory protein PII